jgi:formylglycine-generating enzyme required for sulfatase activity
MNKYLATILIWSFFTSFYAMDAYSQEIKVKKKACVFISDFPDNNMIQIKEILVQNVKRNAVNEIFGQVIQSKTNVKAEPRAPSIPGKTWTDPITGMEFVWVPGGCFEMGCGPWTSQCRENEKPVHEVCIDGFWIGQYEVIQGQWKRVTGKNPSTFTKARTYPVETVSWNEVQVFIKELSLLHQQKITFRLPTEAEWEFACRSGGKPEYFAGGRLADANAVAWHADNSGKTTHPVGMRKPNGLGLYDMSGNVYEWCEDWYDGGYYSISPKHNPANKVKPAEKGTRVRRGGSWEESSRSSRSANRGASSPDQRASWLGFRLVRVP